MLLALTSIILSLLFFSISYCLGRKNPSRYALFTGGAIVTLMLSPLLHFIPKLELQLPFLRTHSSAPLGASDSSWGVWVLGFWVLGSGLLFIRLAYHYLSVRKWRANAERCTSPTWTHRLHECCSLLRMDTIPSLGLCTEISSPVVTGLIYPQILLPNNSAEWSEETINHVLLHELGHVKRRDLWISVASHIACAIYWFNPLVWLLRKQQVSQCEFACDTFVLSSGANAKNYINAICDVAETASKQSHVTLALAMADKASLKKRVSHLLQATPPSSKTLPLTLLVLTASSALAINVIRPLQASAPLPQKSLLGQEVDRRLHADPFPGNKKKE